MDYLLNEEQIMMRDMAREFAEKEIKPYSQDIDITGEIPESLFEQMVDLGFTGVGVPEEYGGSGGDLIDKLLIIYELAKIDGSVASTLSVHGVFSDLLLNFGNDNQKKRYLPEVTSGGKVGAFALTEPGAGSDASAVRMTAKYDEENEEYILNGTKCFISGGSKAKYIVVIALTNPELKSKGLSAFIFDTDTEGFSVGKIENKMGIRGSDTAELVFNNCKVPKNCLIGVEGRGFNYALSTLDNARISIAAMACGLAAGSLEQAVVYSKQRKQFGKPISELQGIQWYIAEMATKTEAAKLLTLSAAKKAVLRERHSVEASMAKWASSVVAREVTNLSLQIHGGYGYMKDFPIERMYRDAKITEIYEGTSEIQKLVISRSILK